MKLSQFKALGVHGHLNFHVMFRNDYTFLIGLNGSGKTSALKLIMALLTPDISELAELPFRTATVVLVDAGAERTIHAVRTSDSLCITADIIPNPLELTAAELALLVEPRSAEETKSPVLAKTSAHPVFQFIRSLATPMFLGIDRRFVSEIPADDLDEARRRNMLVRRSLQEERSLRQGNVAAGLADVNLLVHDTLSEVRRQQEALDTDFRNRLLTGAFKYEPAALTVEAPSAAAIDQYREKQAEIEHAIRSLQIPLEDVRTALDSFFKRMNAVASDLERHPVERARSRQADRQNRRGRPFGATQPPKTPASIPSPKIIEWIVNKPQVDRIMAHLELLTHYNEERSNLRAPIERYLELLNSFLADTKKSVVVADRGVLEVELAHGGISSIGALSSGERQLVVMLGHLALNRRLAGSGIFIVDEPELSLHISWQERFLDAILAANPTVQVVMATHSPAIILQRDDHCESLDAPRGL